MIITAPPASNSVCGRETLFWYDIINFQIMCVTVVRWSRSCLHVQINRVRLPATLFSLLCAFFFLFGLFFLHYFSFWPFFLYSYCWPCWSCTWINIYLKYGVLFWKRDFRSSWSAYWPSSRPDINHKPCQDCPSSETAEFFSVLVDIMTNNTQYTRKCTNLHPTPTLDPLAKVKLANTGRRTVPQISLETPPPRVILRFREFLKIRKTNWASKVPNFYSLDEEGLHRMATMTKSYLF